jgi:steroid 5-alpha reductase family enzyme
VIGEWLGLLGSNALVAILMTWLLLKVSGIAMLEPALAERRPGYAEYVRKTSAFIPWFPRARE